MMQNRCPNPSKIHPRSDEKSKARKSLEKVIPGTPKWTIGDHEGSQRPPQVGPKNSCPLTFLRNPAPERSRAPPRPPKVPPQGVPRGAPDPILDGFGTNFPSILKTLPYPLLPSYHPLPILSSLLPSPHSDGSAPRASLTTSFISAAAAATLARR